MRGKWIGVVALCVFLSGLVFAEAEEAKMTDLTGTVSGPDGNPVAEAELDLYLLTVDQASMSYQISPKGRTKADAEGKFAFSVDTTGAKGYAFYSCLAQKKGLSCGWGTLIGTNQSLFDIKLTEPQKMIGFVQNPDGTPVPEAEVRLVLLAISGEGEQVMFGIEPVEVFVTKTCDTGRFEFNNLPEEATAELLVKKPGKGTLHTLSTSMNPSNGLTYKAGQTDIMLTMQDGFKISGKVVMQDDQKPVAGVPVMAMDTKLPVNLIGRPIESAEDGSFEFDDLAPGDYRVAIQDDNWIAEPLTISVGQASVEDVVLQLTKGGTIEVKVIDSATEEPISGAQVNLRNEENRPQAVMADESGIAKKQVLPGTYQISAYAQGYRYTNDIGTVVVENNKTASITVQLGGQSKISGLVLDPDGKPAEGVVVRIVPGSGTQRDGVTSDENGQFKMGWDPEQMSWAEGEFYLVAACQDENLAGRGVNRYGYGRSNN